MDGRLNMPRHYELEPVAWHAQTLIFDWDEVQGTVTGPGADYILKHAAQGSISVHPMPWSHTFGAEPLKSKTDIAAIIGYQHKLPDDLAAWYPQCQKDEDDDSGYSGLDIVN
jgi:hypothetical protein